MIEKMLKLQAVVSQADRDKLLDKLHDLGVLHIVPVDPSQAAAEDKIAVALDEVHRAIPLLEAVEYNGRSVEGDSVTIAEEVLENHHCHEDCLNKIAACQKQIDVQYIWGETRITDLVKLGEAGVEPKFYTIPVELVHDFKAELVMTLSGLAADNPLIAVIDRGDAAVIPPEAEPVEMITVDNPALRQEQAKADKDLVVYADRMKTLAGLLPQLRERQIELCDQARFSAAFRGGFNDQHLYAIQGWIPAKAADSLHQELSAAGVESALRTMAPTEDEEPPTLVVYPKWAQPIKALFQVLGTTPGYREYDLAPFFMLAMPIFTAMLVGDAGYGLIFTLAGIFSYKKLKAIAGAPAPQLVIIFGSATFLWGVLTANYFGVGPEGAGALGGLMESLGILWRENAEEGRNIVMQISFTIGCIHLLAAHVRRLVAFWPGQLAIAEIGWCVFIFSMFTLVWLMFFVNSSGPLIPTKLTIIMLIGGWAVIAGFCHPVKSPIKRIGIGILSNLMSISNAFGDMMSYIRLMAVGLASYYIASAFNGLAGGVSESMGGFGIVFAVIILVMAHALNIILCLIAIFAHGVRLNMLEFSNNAGVQWSGVPFNPFRDVCRDA